MGMHGYYVKEAMSNPPSFCAETALVAGVAESTRCMVPKDGSYDFAQDDGDD